MGLHHRHKQRILTTLVTLITLTIAVDTFIVLSPLLAQATALLYAFAVGIGIITAYECYGYRHSYERSTIINTLTQIFLGAVLFGCIVISLLLNVFLQMTAINSYLTLCTLVLLTTFLLLRKFDTFLQREVQQRFPMSVAPRPKVGA
jgi:hypothetical protein